MNRIIYKYSLQITDTQIIDMPIGAEIISLQLQNKIPCIWAIVNPEADLQGRTILTIGTGHPMPATGKYISTYQPLHGLVFHVFEAN